MSSSAGRVMIIPKGAYAAGTTYSKYDSVSYAGDVWVAKQTSTGVSPVEGDYWLKWFDATPTIVNNLTATVAGSALDATQGKALSDQIATLNSNLNDKTGIKNIPPGSDLNSLIADGYYSCKTNAAAATILNSPTNAAFEMEVRIIDFKVNSWSYIHQIIRSYSGNAMYIRLMSSDGSGVFSFSPWNQYTAYALLSVTFTAAGWTASSDGTYYTQTATNSRILAGMTLKPPTVRHTGVKDTDAAMDTALAIIQKGTSTPATGSITVKAWEKPATDVTVYYDCVY